MSKRPPYECHRREDESRVFGGGRVACRGLERFERPLDLTGLPPEREGVSLSGSRFWVDTRRSVELASA
jgi:hypothetical protein